MVNTPKTPKGTPKVAGKNTPKNTPKNVKTPLKTPGKQGQTPKGQTPKGQTPKVQTPKVQTPKVQTPKGVQKTPGSAKKTPKITSDNLPKHLLQQKFGKENLEVVKKGSQTPQPTKGPKTPVTGGKKAKTPKSAPPGDPKRKKLTEEIDEEISDEEFEEGLVKVATKKKQNGTPSNIFAEINSDDDEEDDSDFDGEGDSDDDDDLDMDDDDDSDDDDEDDNEDDDDDEEEDDSEDETPVAAKAQKKQAAALKQAGAPAPAAELQKEAKKKAGKEAKKVVKEAKRAELAKVAISEVDATEDAKRREALDKRTLFVKNFSPKTTEDDIRGLSADILEVRVRSQKIRKTKEILIKCAFLEFKDMKAADRNYMILKGKTLKGKDIEVDYMGSKSNYKKGDTVAPEQVDPKKIFITGFDKKGTTVEDLKKLMPTCVDIQLPRRKKELQGFAFAFFNDEKTAKEAHDKLQGVKLKGRTLNVIFAKKSKHQPGYVGKRKAEEKTGEPVAKKAKRKVEEVEEEEDDDEDDMEEDDDDDEDDDDEDDDDDDDDDDE